MASDARVHPTGSFDGRTCAGVLLRSAADDRCVLRRHHAAVLHADACALRRRSCRGLGHGHALHRLHRPGPDRVRPAVRPVRPPARHRDRSGHLPGRRGDRPGRADDRGAAGRPRGAGLRRRRRPGGGARHPARPVQRAEAGAEPGDRHRHLLPRADPGASDRRRDRRGGRVVAQHLRGHAGLRRSAARDPGACARDPAAAPQRRAAAGRPAAQCACRAGASAVAALPAAGAGGAVHDADHRGGHAACLRARVRGHPHPVRGAVRRAPL